MLLTTSVPFHYYRWFLLRSSQSNPHKYLENTRNMFWKILRKISSSGKLCIWMKKLSSSGPNPCTKLVQNTYSIHSRSFQSWTLTLYFQAQVLVPDQVKLEGDLKLGLEGDPKGDFRGDLKQDL